MSDRHIAYVAMLPLRPVLDDPESAEAAPDDALRGVTVMVPDDRKHVRDALEAGPKSVGAHVVPCASGDKAMPGPRGLPTAQWPAVLLCDIVGFPAHLTTPVPVPTLIATIGGVTSRAV